MSSTGRPRLLGPTDVAIVRNGLRHTGFRDRKPMSGLDRDAARRTSDLYQHGTRKPDVLITTIGTWAGHVSDMRAQSTAIGMGG